jgi:hypothetical protein
MGRVDNTWAAKAASDLSGKRGFVVKLVSADTVDVVSSQKDFPFGILLNNPTAGQVAELALEGVIEAVADGSGTPISLFARVGFDNTGRQIVKAANDPTMCGHALDTCAIFGGTVRLLIRWGR